MVDVFSESWLIRLKKSEPIQNPVGENYGILSFEFIHEKVLLPCNVELVTAFGQETNDSILVLYVCPFHSHSFKINTYVEMTPVV